MLDATATEGFDEVEYPLAQMQAFRTQVEGSPDLGWSAELERWSEKAARLGVHPEAYNCSGCCDNFGPETLHWPKQRSGINIGFGRRACMGRSKFAVVVLIVFLIGVSVLPGQSQKGPEFLVDKGACPFECCTYGDWRAEKSTKLLAEPKAGSNVIGTVRKGIQVKAVTGEVHSRAVNFIVRKRREGYEPGDILQVYSYVGEGVFKVWVDGKLDEVSLDIGRGGGPTGAECLKDDYCWGELNGPLDSVWWVKIKTREGLVGWTNEPDNFGGKDSCG